MKLKLLTFGLLFSYFGASYSNLPEEDVIKAYNYFGITTYEQRNSFNSESLAYFCLLNKETLWNHYNNAHGSHEIEQLEQKLFLRFEPLLKKLYKKAQSINKHLDIIVAKIMNENNIPDENKEYLKKCVCLEIISNRHYPKPFRKRALIGWATFATMNGVGALCLLLIGMIIGGKASG